MARVGIEPERVAEVIAELESQGVEPTVTAIRDRLGTGSYSTIGAVLTDWRQGKAKQARPAIPEAPHSVRNLAQQLWAEAWNTATRVHEPERQAFARERQENEQGKKEMVSEIARLEGEVETAKEAGAHTAQALTEERDKLNGDVHTLRVALATTEGALSEARKQADEVKERSRELSERLIVEAAKAQTLAGQVAKLQKKEMKE